VEVFFQIVHTRLPLLNPALFRKRLQAQLSPSHNPQSSSRDEKIPHPALVAVVIAWGTKFSEHPLLVADRRRPGGQSLLSKMLIDRTRDLAEALKVHRVPSEDHVVIGLLIEPLQNRKPILRSSDSSVSHSRLQKYLAILKALHLIASIFEHSNSALQGTKAFGSGRRSAIFSIWGWVILPLSRLPNHTIPLVKPVSR
jgi:hypothetical protein